MAHLDTFAACVFVSSFGMLLLFYLRIDRFPIKERFPMSVILSMVPVVFSVFLLSTHLANQVCNPYFVGISSGITVFGYSILINRFKLIYCTQYQTRLLALPEKERQQIRANTSIFSLNHHFHVGMKATVLFVAAMLAAWAIATYVWFAVIDGGCSAQGYIFQEMSSAGIIGYPSFLMILYKIRTLDDRVYFKAELKWLTLGGAAALIAVANAFFSPSDELIMYPFGAAAMIITSVQTLVPLYYSTLETTVANKNKVPLLVLLGFPEGRHKFEEFLIQEYSSHILHFWREVENWQQNYHKKDKTANNQIALKIFDRYLAPYSHTAVSLPLYLFTGVRTFFSKLNPSTTIIPSHIFDECWDGAFRVMDTGSYERFRGTKAYEALNFDEEIDRLTTPKARPQLPAVIVSNGPTAAIGSSNNNNFN